MFVDLNDMLAVMILSHIRNTSTAMLPPVRPLFSLLNSYKVRQCLSAQKAEGIKMSLCSSSLLQPKGVSPIQMTQHNGVVSRVSLWTSMSLADAKIKLLFVSVFIF